ncbi:transglycosylase domain-containing protein [Micromonospora sp. DR5-3]|uniref:transglycosylase domain-containing protein n=1 Tax=unclassified Micromonospora TaxID=2617518 RepID=UPI0011D9F17B|nr:MULTISPECIES: transglycosylase domain-containing protein [unclassified Micromonospora]MCW3813854.1 transglycosylase domain-containing protein [Micromonospora sp. DR5-3]TYC25470.1 penicillin-binding protein [Micromonospora sp. MP36]
MNYGDSSSSRGRAQIPGPSGDADYGGSAHGNGWSSGSEGGASARASVTPRGSASGGRASVGGVAPTPRGAAGSASVGRAGAGRASVPVSPAPGGASGRAGAGRASVPVSPAGPAGRASVGAASVGTAGRASVGSAAVGGRATVARAGVPGMAGGGPGGPGGPTGPGRGGRGGDDPGARARAKKRRRINMLIAGFAVFIMLAGIGVVGFTYYSQNVILPQDTPPPLSTTIQYSNGDLIARVGAENRTFVNIKDVPEYVQNAVAAAEDRNFYRHSGVDYKGIARAAWNNLTGGDKQGASTITQQYARNAFDNLNQDTYARKVKEAILASKLNDRYSKPEIMQHYLNVIYFGRGAYGIQAAAQTYFGKDVSKLTVAEAAVLAALIKQPEPSATHRGYDPADNLQAAKDRWDYVIQGMITEGWLDAAGKQPHPTEYPLKALKPKPKNASGLTNVGKTPNGNIVNYVKSELRDLKLCTDDEAAATLEKPLCSQALQKGGYRITTTIDKKMQAAALEAAQRKSKGSELDGQPTNLMAAVVSIDPQSGEVRAYYGGDDGTGTDYAGKNYDDSGAVSGGHSPGSSFKIYTLAAALKEGISIKSRWKGTAFTPDGVEFKVSNAGADKVSCGDSCTLELSTLKSLNVPFYYITEKIGADKVLDMAKRAGVTTMWRTDTNPAKGYDLTKSDPKDLAPNPFFNVIGYGQYPITVLDHANGVATFANQGVYHKAHFIRKVERQDQTGKWRLLSGPSKKGEQRIPKDIVADVTSVLEQYPAKSSHRPLANGRKVAEKTGTWELNAKTTDNGDAWMIGYTPQLATAVWVGNVKDRKAIKTKGGANISGAGMPGAIFQRFMNDALKGKEKKDFPPAANVGKDDTGNGEMPPPPAPTQPGCDNPLGLFCPNGGGNNGGGNNGGGNNGGGNTGTWPTDPRGPGGGGNGGTGGGLLPTTPPRQTY